jgi:hypothetical protein
VRVCQSKQNQLQEEREELDCVRLILEADSVIGKRGEEMSRRVKDVLLFEYEPGEEE